ncbi:serine/threonine-protein kinase [Actinokineospora bangkokensis]|uniref:non-specific serine/threonine protein kinase n=1 Tax=Actinokineospora bangkokensis TaxID=1193682 RepID=A0A1Q9LGE7_9PSEU|nr:hypothetical protein BJP25_27960 [Actinokineospora bangkokensis]
MIAGRYRLREVLGQGSMGTVWAAYDEFLRRVVAVKEVRLPPGVPEREADELRERTLREARAIAVVSHPNVVTLHDVAQVDGDPFVVMEYVPSRSLAEVLRDHGPLGVAQAAVVADAVAAALQCAHEAGITHRDVKPGNVLLGRDGRVTLTDFGIARNVSERTLTKSGVMLGSPAYIAPEVASGGGVTPRADLWGLGATLFAAVEGHAPYDPHAQVVATLAAVVDGEPPVPAHDGPLRRVITGLMVKDPAARLPLAEVRELLVPLLPGPGTQVFDGLALPVRDVERPTVQTPPVPPPQPPGEASAPLAAAPGPLPFERRPAPTARPRRRGALGTLLLAVLAVLLFSGAAVGGFSLVRTVGGAPLRPPEPTAAQPPPSSAPLGRFVEQTADASPLEGTRGAAFRIPVPQDWVKFVEQRTNDGAPDSTRVHWVSPDGASELAVERFPQFFPTGTAAGYVQLLSAQEPQFQLVSGPTEAAGVFDLAFRTVESGPAAGGQPEPSRTRSTFAQVSPIGGDLWVITATVPIEQEDLGKQGLFDRAAPGFSVVG